MDYFNIIRGEDVLNVQCYELDNIKEFINEGHYTYITEGKGRKTIIRNCDGHLEGLLVNSMDLLMEDVCFNVSSFIKGYHYVIVCPFLFHDWDMCCK